MAMQNQDNKAINITKEELLLAQNELSASMIIQIFKVKRFIILSAFVFIAHLMMGWEMSLILLMLAALLMYKAMPIKIRDKEGLVHQKVLFKISDVIRKRKILERIDNLIVRYYMWSLLAILIFVVSHNAYALKITPPPPQVQQQVNQINQKTIESAKSNNDSLANPPPPLPVGTPMPSQSPIPSEPPQPIVNKVKINFNSLSKRQVESYIQNQEIKQALIDEEYHLRVGGYKRYYIKPTNYFHYIPEVPLLFRFDQKIKRVLALSNSIKIVYDRNFAFVKPPMPTEGNLVGFIVVLADGKPYYFLGERYNFIYGSNFSYLDKQTRQVLDLHTNPYKKHKNTIKHYWHIPNRRLTTYYYYITPQYIPVNNIVQAFLTQENRCPMNYETFTFNGQTYQFRMLTTNRLNKSNQFFACGHAFEIRNLR